mgnify:CR=1 FL=1
MGINYGGIAGLRKNGSFLPVPDILRRRMKLRDKYQYCLLVSHLNIIIILTIIMSKVPWIITYTLITICWLIAFLPYTAVVVWLSV